ncbi:HD domain-containing protein [Mucilaginibacter sp. HMF5004]|uniref:phosphonate degradation HD-domain oxygenase n=1 Tax=Mucilaginibacter rivuli TaxID=2857527 RepID=UPI001C6044D6|nr:phosphonate degradation HD-domain oxygenase [Mucilaginibacter rivuli]MBW4888526.1 HD domain-containing protein [Mucilaginibacter rivuli]
MAQLPTDPEIIVDEVFALYEQHGNDDYIGEPVSQLEHMWQAALLAEGEGYSEEIILAAFFHDIGHLCAADNTVASMDGFGNVDHEHLGADYLRKKGFSETVAELVESHVTAKRYLTYKYPEYYHQLSPASKATLAFQGGVMSALEAAEFEMNPYANVIVKLRQWDDEAKVTDIPVDGISRLKMMAVRHLTANNAVD